MQHKATTGIRQERAFYHEGGGNTCNQSTDFALVRQQLLDAHVLLQGDSTTLGEEHIPVCAARPQPMNAYMHAEAKSTARSGERGERERGGRNHTPRHEMISLTSLMFSSRLEGPREWEEVPEDEAEEAAAAPEEEPAEEDRAAACSLDRISSWKRVWRSWSSSSLRFCTCFLACRNLMRISCTIPEAVCRRAVEEVRRGVGGRGKKEGGEKENRTRRRSAGGESTGAGRAA